MPKVIKVNIFKQVSVYKHIRTDQQGRALCVP